MFLFEGLLEFSSFCVFLFYVVIILIELLLNEKFLFVDYIGCDRLIWLVGVLVLVIVVM